VARHLRLFVQRRLRTAHALRCVSVRGLLPCVWTP
jgi:hypothetical protein